jgi:hypothetical protein
MAISIIWPENCPLCKLKTQEHIICRTLFLAEAENRKQSNIEKILKKKKKN